MTHADLLSINNVAARLGLSVHQLRRWELMFGLEIKRGRGQQRQYRQEDLSVLERIKELVEQGWPTSQIRPQLEAEGLITPKLIGLPPTPGNPEVLMESVIGFRNFVERRFIEISKQIDELRQLLISLSLRQELQGERLSPWQPIKEELLPPVKERPPQEITLGPSDVATEAPEVQEQVGQFEEVSDQNYLTVLGKVLDHVGWSDDQADQYCSKNFGVSDWTQLGRSQAEKFIGYLHEQDSEGTEDATA
ncbi:MAG TPA: helix-turn-helix domain-containing protein [Candidatus Binatia bacterium]|nr:helix-turn-helix domain-containing protein [Candidatus Binatia bacterium]